MTSTSLPPLRPEQGVCANPAGGASGRSGVHASKQRRYNCHACGKTFVETLGTPLFGLKYPLWMVRIGLTLLAFGCPLQAIVAAFAVDERTVAEWQRNAGLHATAVQEPRGCQGPVDRGHGQGDELDVTTHAGTVGMATAMTVCSRVFGWGAIAAQRATSLITQVVHHGRAAAQLGQPIVWAVDGCAAWRSAILRVFRDPLRTGKRGRPRLVVWAEVPIVHVVKPYRGRHLTGVPRRLAHGWMRCAEAIMPASQVGVGVITTAYSERLNATFRTWLPAVTRRSRTPARVASRLEAALCWMGVVSTVCRVQTTRNGTPALAADRTDHRWTVDELLRYRPKRE